MKDASFAPDQPMRCLLIYPAFPENAYWNWKDICRAFKRQAMGIPLGLITMASMLPKSWEIRLMDLNAVDWDEEIWQWADVVAVGGMIIQQNGIFEMIRRAKKDGKFVFVGGPDVSSQPVLYQEADALVLGEAEASVPLWLDAWRKGRPGGTFEAAEKPDVSLSPLPRFDLLDLEHYWSINVQFSRGCPFNCEFCDIIELYGRNPRTKTGEQMTRELQAVYDLGYRGWVDIVDDNFVGNKRDVKKMLPVLADWCRDHKYPFYFSTQASLNLADDEEFMQAMTAAEFQIVFMGIETPDPSLLATTQKRINALKPIAERLQKVADHGIAVTAGFILGFDGESEHSADSIIECIETNAIPLAMTSLLSSLPNTQLSRRLAREGRLLEAASLRPIKANERHEVVLPVVMGEVPEQSNMGGLKFLTTRDRYQILEDHRRVWETIYDPKRYFARAQRAARRVKMKMKHLPGFKTQMRETRGFLIMAWKLCKMKGARGPFLRLLLRSIFLGRSRFIYAMRLAIAYVHFGRLRRRITTGLMQRIEYERSRNVPRMRKPETPEPHFEKQRAQAHSHRR